MKTIAVAGTFDTKGREYRYVKGLIEELGLNAYMIHTGVFQPEFEPDISNQEIARASGHDIDELARRKDRALATRVLAEGMERLIPKLYKEGKFDGILSFGGSGGTALVTPAMRALPIGVPKIMVSTMASGNVEQYVGTSDIVMMPSIVDVAGLNSISCTIFRNAVTAMAGMILLGESLKTEKREEKPLVAATMFGVTTPCVSMAKDVLERNGYEVLVFHATGTGGKTMEKLISEGYFQGVLDLTTTEWCDQVVGGVLAAGPDRCSAAVKQGIPLVISTGALDMVNFGPEETVLPRFRERKLYRHNPSVTLMRTTVKENIEIAGKLAEKLNLVTGKAALLLPLLGISAIDAEGQPFYGPDEDLALFGELKAKIANPSVEIIEIAAHINDEKFAVAAANKLIQLMKK